MKIVPSSLVFVNLLKLIGLKQSPIRFGLFRFMLPLITIISGYKVAFISAFVDDLLGLIFHPSGFLTYSFFYPLSNIITSFFPALFITFFKKIYHKIYVVGGICFFYFLVLLWDLFLDSFVLTIILNQVWSKELFSLFFFQRLFKIPFDFFWNSFLLVKCYFFLLKNKKIGLTNHIN